MQILINEQHLGTDASRDDALRMIDALQSRGYNVAYGDKIHRDDDASADSVPDSVWWECLRTAFLP